MLARKDDAEKKEKAEADRDQKRITKKPQKGNAQTRETLSYRPRNRSPISQHDGLAPLLGRHVHEVVKPSRLIRPLSSLEELHLCVLRNAHLERRQTPRDTL